ncbi:MAG: pyridoxal phosphate-dependent aminotransferase [Candidatus Omnitrophota bacterium]
MALFSQRSGWPRRPNPLSRILEELRRRPVFVFDLSQSNPTACGLTYAQEELCLPLGLPHNTHYSPNCRGDSKIRQWIVKYYRGLGSRTLDDDDIFLTAGTSEAYTYLFRLLANPGDNVLLPAPGYPLFSFLCDINDLEARSYCLDASRGWRVDLSSLLSGIDEKTRAVVLINPHNPTGAYIDPRDYADICALCRKRGLAIICDEVFFDYRFCDSFRPRSLAANSGVLTFVLGGLSKMFALPQMKISWLAACGPDADVREAGERLEIIADTYLSVNTPAQNGFLSWARHKDRIQGDILARIRHNYAAAEKIIRENNAGTLFAPQGGWSALWRMPQGAAQAADLAREALEKDYVFIHPGYFFDFPSPDNFLVLSLLVKPDILRQGAQRLARRITLT